MARSPARTDERRRPGKSRAGEQRVPAGSLGGGREFESCDLGWAAEAEGEPGADAGGDVEVAALILVVALGVAEGEVGQADGALLAELAGEEELAAVVAGEEGLLSGAKPGLVIVVHSTILPATVEALSALAAKQGTVVLDACVTGNVRAPDPMFKLFVGGEADTIAGIRPSGMKVWVTFRCRSSFPKCMPE